MSRNDLPSEKATNHMARVRETLQTMLGFRGDKLDRVLTLRDVVDSGLLEVRPGANIGSGAVPLLPGQNLPQPEVYVPDLTPPPTPDFLTATGAISHVLVTVPAATYSQGHGHLRTRLYGVSPTALNPNPVFSDAVEVGQFDGTVWAMASNPSTTWRLWAKWESKDNVLSASPAGGTNGVAVTTGQDVTKMVQAMTGPGNPFTILTAPVTIDGFTYPEGTYSVRSFIIDAQITNAKIANLAVDDAKVANLSVSKLVAGSIAVGQHIQSTGYVAGTSGWRINGDGTAEFSGVVVRGTVYATAGEFRGVDVKTAAGEVILSASSPLRRQVTGGANLVSGIALWSFGTGVWLHTNASVGAEGSEIIIPSGVNWTDASSPVMNLSVKGTVFTVSFLAFSPAPRTLVVDLFPDTLPESSVLLTAGWNAYSFTWTSSHANMASCRLRFFAGTEAAQIAITNVKLEAGSMATPWVSNSADFPSINNKLDTSNVTTYINPGAIGNTQIGGDIFASNWVSSGGANGWYLDRNGNFYANSGTFKGNITGATGTFAGRVSGGEFTTGAYTGYAWPPAGAGNIGTYLGPSGLLIGNANNGKYFQVSSEGNIFAPGFDVQNGVLSVRQANVINTLNLAGNAVTVPIGAYTAGSVAVSTDWTNIQSAYIEGQGFQIFLLCSASGSATITMEGSTTVSSPRFAIRLLRNGADTGTLTESIGSASIHFMENPGSGGFTYTLQMRMLESGGTNPIASARSLLVLGTKR